MTPRDSQILLHLQQNCVARIQRLLSENFGVQVHRLNGTDRRTRRFQIQPTDFRLTVLVS